MKYFITSCHLSSIIRPQFVRGLRPLLREKAPLVAHITAIDHNHFHYRHYYHIDYTTVLIRLLVSTKLTNLCSAQSYSQ